MRRGGAMLDLAWLLLGGVIIGVLLIPPRTTADAPGPRSYLTPEVGERWHIAQRFRMNRAELNAVAVRGAAVGPVGGHIQLTLRDRDARGVERTASVAAADLVREPVFVFHFDPIEKSAGHEFELEVVPASADPARGVALWANKGPRQPDSTLRINGEPRWGSLVFHTFTPATSLFNGLLRADDPARPPAWLALVGLAGGWLALRYVLRAVVRVEPDPSGSTEAGLSRVRL